MNIESTFSPEQARASQNTLRSVFHSVPDRQVAMEFLLSAIDFPSAQEGLLLLEQRLNHPDDPGILQRAQEHAASKRDWFDALSGKELATRKKLEANQAISHAKMTTAAKNLIDVGISTAFTQGIDRQDPATYELFRFLCVTDDTWDEEGIFAADSRLRKPIEERVHEGLLGAIKVCEEEVSFLETSGVTEGSQERLQAARGFIEDDRAGLAKFYIEFNEIYGEQFVAL